MILSLPSASLSLTRSFAQTLISAQTKAVTESSTAQYRAITKSISVHMEMILLRAFSKAHSTPAWSSARAAARQVLFKLLDVGMDRVHAVLLRLPSVTAQKDKDIAELRLVGPTGQLWKRVRATILPSDSDAARDLVISTARSVFFAPVLPARFNPKLDGDERRVSKLVEVLKPMNENMSRIHDGFMDTLVAFADSNSASTLKGFCGQSGVAEALLMLVMAPTPELSNAAQAVVSQAYDVDTRADCLRALLEHHPSQVFDGVERYLARFKEVVEGYLEACAPSMALVRCFTDLLDVLCNRNDGLLFNSSFTAKHSKTIRRLPTLWKRMCTAISAIIKLCPGWSRRWPSEEMVLWMRDALIFARELLPQRRVIESAAVVASNPSSSSRLSDSPSKLSNTGTRMVQDLQPVLRSVLEWLRLTDMELLYQAYTLMMDLFDVFRETRIPPLRETLADVKRHVESQLEKKKAGVGLTSKLTTRQLENIMGKVEEWDEEVLVPSSAPVFNKVKEKSVERKNEVIVVEDSTGEDDILLVGESSRKKPIKMQPAPVPKIKKERPKPFTSKSASTLVSTSKQQLSTLDRIRQQAMAQSWRFKEDEGQRKKRDSMRDVLPTPFIGSKPMVPLPKAASKPPSIMSSTTSSEESSSDEEETKGDKSTVGSLAALHESPKRATKQQRRGVIFDFNQPAFGGSSIATKTQGGSRPTLSKQRPRYAPDLLPLHQAILSWNYDHDGPTPPFKGPSPKLHHVPDVFRGHEHYLDVFHPLLLTECWNALIKSKDENLDIVEIRVSGRLYADMWVEINVSLIGSRPQGWSLSDTDIVLLKHPSGKGVLAKVQTTNRQRDNIGATLRYSSDPSNDIGRVMTIDSVWNLSRVYRYIMSSLIP
jgi:senataxin